jgi:cyclic pyranopterin phosphate synthase
VKVNTVVRRGHNEHAILQLAERFRGSGIVLRFIEYMDVGSTNGWSPGDVVSAAEIVERIGERWALEPLPSRLAGEVATRYRYADGAGELGVIHSVSVPFCGSCTRARLSADGKLFTCLFANHGNDVRALLRSGADDAELQAALEAVWTRRADRYSAERAELLRADPDARATEPRIEMSYIGG